jgi:predicted nucleic-acid-binding Zn-ribbon protein
MTIKSATFYYVVCDECGDRVLNDKDIFVAGKTSSQIIKYLWECNHKISKNGTITCLKCIEEKEATYKPEES